MGHLKPRAAELRRALEQAPASAQKPTLLTIAEACAYLRISKWTLYRYLQRNELPSITFGKRRFFHEPDLLAFIEQHKAGVPA